MLLFQSEVHRCAVTGSYTTKPCGPLIGATVIKDSSRTFRWIDTVMYTNAKNTGDAPWLEYCPTNGSTPDRFPLDASRRLIGRGDKYDWQVKSMRVSREHVSLEHSDAECRFRDLGSTNGTFLNGQQVTEGVLVHGDILVVADVEFTFFSPIDDAKRQTMTETLPFTP